MSMFSGSQSHDAWESTNASSLYTQKRIDKYTHIHKHTETNKHTHATWKRTLLPWGVFYIADKSLFNYKNTQREKSENSWKSKTTYKVKIVQNCRYCDSRIVASLIPDLKVPLYLMSSRWCNTSVNHNKK